MRDDRHIEIQRDVNGSAIVSGNGNTIYVYYHLNSQASIAPPPTKTEDSTPLGPNPYRGLAAFQVEDADVYFGREAQVERLWTRLKELSEQAGRADARPRLLPILGPSGCGKSSLARAGLLAELARRPLPGYRQPRVVVMTPGSTPLESLGIVLARIATGELSPVEKAEEFERVLRRKNDQGNYDGLRRIANALPGIESSPLVVLIDQFEEVYSLCKSPEERVAFIDGLVEAASASEGRVLVVLTLRSDFLGETQRHRHLNEIIGSDQVVVVPAMNEEELRRAIAEPAKQAGRPLTEETIDLLVEQSKGRDGSLPLLQFALTSIWEGLTEGRNSAETLRAINGVGGALVGKAQQIYTSLTPKEQDFARRLFIGVVELGEGVKDTRRRAAVESLMSAQDDPALVKTVIEQFSTPRARLLTLSSDEGKEVIEATHETLFEHWQQLKDWLDGQRNLIRQQRRINTIAEEWRKQGKKRGYLLQGQQLDDSRDFQKQHSNTLPLSQLATDLIQISIQQRWTNRILIASFAIVPLIAIEGFLREEAVKRDYAILRGNNVTQKPDVTVALVAGCRELQGWPRFLYPVGERIFGNCRFLIRQNLSKVNFSGADLSGADFEKANLSSADLSSANLSGANLSGANLSGANFYGANLSGANLTFSDLNNADLGNTDLTDANLSIIDGNIDLNNAKLCRTQLPSEINLEQNCESIRILF